MELLNRPCLAYLMTLEGRHQALVWQFTVEVQVINLCPLSAVVVFLLLCLHLSLCSSAGIPGL